MEKMIKSAYRYPIFFCGMMLMIASAFATRYIALKDSAAAVLVLVGFALLVLSLLPI